MGINFYPYLRARISWDKTTHACLLFHLPMLFLLSFLGLCIPLLWLHICFDFHFPHSAFTDDLVSNPSMIYRPMIYEIHYLTCNEG